MQYNLYFTSPPLLHQEIKLDQSYKIDKDCFQGNGHLIAKTLDGHVAHHFFSLEEYNNFVTITQKDNMANYAQATPEEEEKKDAINPAHYKEFMVIRDEFNRCTDSIQWLEHEQYKPYWRNNMRAFVQAVLLQSDKYLSRLGQKDDETQEMEKALWYLKFATAIMKNGLRPIRVSQVDYILNTPADKVAAYYKERRNNG